MKLLWWLRALSRQQTMQDVFYVGPADDGLINREVRLGYRPCPEYLLFAGNNKTRLFPYDVFVDGVDPLPSTKRTERVKYLLREIVAAKKPIVVTATEHIGHAVAGYLASLGLPIMVNVIMHGFLFSDESRMLSLARSDNVRLLCLSETIRERCVAVFGVPVSRAINTGYGVDVDFFHPMSTYQLEPLVVSAGTAKRDYETLLAAVSRLNVGVSIAADSAWSKGAIRDPPFPLPPNVSFGSCGTYLKLRKLYDFAMFVVVPLYDVPRACGYAVISEAMAMGKAVIATKTECYSDFLVDGATGFYVNPGNSPQLRDYILMLLEDQPMAQRMGAAGRARVCKRFSLKEYCSKLAAAVHGY